MTTLSSAPAERHRIDSADSTSSTDSTERLVMLSLGVAMLVRLMTLGLYPLTDTTEARYAEVARKMAELSDWVTPWYDYGVPFWAKPPLSTWLTAGSFKLFGLSEFAARLPHYLLAVATAWLVWDWVRTRDRRQALLGVTMLCGTVIFLVSSGAVMTDMALALGLTMTMRGLWLAMFGAPTRRGSEAWLAFVGLAIGLLAKGPIALVLTGLPFAAWALATGNVGLAWRAVAWCKGALLAAALALPWYAMAEHATPGFLNYFLLGEHWQRFITPGWQGDRYGTAHVFARGTILPFAAFGFLPWAVLLPLLAIGRSRQNDKPALSEERREERNEERRKERSFRIYLLCWALAPCVFFAMARNILWTYALPGIPAAAMLGAAWLSDDRRFRLINQAVAFGTAVAVLGVCGLIVLRGQDFSLKSTKELVEAFHATAAPGQGLYFVGAVPYSASFYTQGQAHLLKNAGDLRQLNASQRTFVGLTAQQYETLDETLKLQLVMRGRYGRYLLAAFSKPEPEVEPKLQANPHPGSIDPPAVAH